MTRPTQTEQVLVQMEAALAALGVSAIERVGLLNTVAVIQPHIFRSLRSQFPNADAVQRDRLMRGLVVILGCVIEGTAECPSGSRS